MKLEEVKGKERKHDVFLDDGSIVLSSDKIVMKEPDYLKCLEDFKEMLEEETYAELSGKGRYIEVARKDIKHYFDSFMNILEKYNENI